MSKSRQVQFLRVERGRVTNRAQNIFCEYSFPILTHTIFQLLFIYLFIYYSFSLKKNLHIKAKQNAGYLLLPTAQMWMVAG